MNKKIFMNNMHDYATHRLKWAPHPKPPTSMLFHHDQA